MSRKDIEDHVAGQAKPRRSKYGAIRTVVDGITFASRAEARYYEVLKERVDSGEIVNLRLQKRYPIIVNEQKICVYVADMDFDVAATGQHVTVDVKGRLTPVYKLKKRLVRACHGIEIQEVAA